MPQNYYILFSFMAQNSPYTIIAIDGPSGSGKSTTAKLVGAQLGFTYLDTGAMYRAVTFAAVQAGIAPQDHAALEALLQRTEVGFDASNRITVDGVLRENEIRTPAISAQVSHYSAVPAVRNALTHLQRAIGERQNCILDGRDIGTVVFPQAQYKFFLVTDYRVRAERRLAELLAKGEQTTLEAVEENLRERDRIDSTRASAPLRKADDAIEIDTTHLSIEQQVQKVLSYVRVVA